MHMKRVFILGLIIFQAVLSTGARAAEEMAVSDVKGLREQKFEKMPYLDRGYIKSTISEETLKDTQAFLGAGKKGLSDIIGRAIHVHTAALASKERIGLARRRVMVAVRELFPELEISYQHQDGSLGGGTGPFNSQNYQFSFTQPIFRGGILWHTLLQERAEFESAEKEYDQVIADLINDVSAAYFEYNRVIEVVSDQQEAVNRVRRFANISKQKWDEEIISEIEHLNVESLYSQMKYDYESTKQELEIAKLELQRFINVPIEEDIMINELYNIENLVKEGASPVTSTPGLSPGYGQAEKANYGVESGSEIPNLEVLIDLAYQNRPELQVESSKLSAARLEERIRWGELMPHADLTVEFGKLGEAANVVSLDPKLRKEFRLFLELSWNAAGNRVSYEFENDSNAPSVTQFAGGGSGTQRTTNTFTAGILDGLDAFVDIKEAEVDKLDQIVELENIEKEVIRDVKEAYYDYQRAVIQVESTIKRVDYRDRLVRLAAHRLEKNEVEISEYVQAEIDLLREKSDLHKALTDYFTAKAKLNRSIGMREFFPIEESYDRG